MKNKISKISRILMLVVATSSVALVSKAQNQQEKPAVTKAPPAATANPSPAPQNGLSEEEMNQRKKMAELNRQIKEAEKAGTAETPEIVAKKEEFKKLQDSFKAKMMAEQEKRRKENQAAAAKNNEANQKIIQLTNEIKDAEKAGKGEAPETVAKRTELEKLKNERDSKMKAEREKMSRDYPSPSKEDMEMNKKMGQLNKEIREAEKDGKGETPEVLAKKAELKKMQDARMAKMKAEREKMMKEKQAATPVKEEKKAEPAKEAK